MDADWNRMDSDRHPRRLATILNQFNASQTGLTLNLENSGALPCLPSAQCLSVTGLFAAELFTLIEVAVTPDRFAPLPGRLRIVRGTVDSTLADEGKCMTGDYEYGAHSAVVSDPWAGLGSGVTFISGNEVMRAQDDLVFKQGGVFRICYSDDGSFGVGHGDVVPPTLEVYGVYDERVECATDSTCLTERPYRCYLSKLAHNNRLDEYDVPTSCILDFSGTGQGFVGPVGKGTWSQKWITTYNTNGVVDTVTPTACAGPGQSSEPFLCKTGGADCENGVYFVEPNATADNKQITLPVGRPDLDEFSSPAFAAYTVSACYCPEYGGCDQYTDYIQQIGIIHFYITKVCHNGFAAFMCAEDYTGASPQHRFSIRLECPSDACSATHFNRIKVVAQSPMNDLPSWDTRNGCAGAVHGVNERGMLVLDAINNPDVSNVHGETRQDFKYWNYRNSSSGLVFSNIDSGFLFKTGTTDHELRSMHNAETFDICYCDGNCGDGDPITDSLTSSSNWFKVGQLRFSPFRLVSAVSNETRRQDEFIITYINQPGSLGLWRPPTDYNVLGLIEGGFVKLVSDPTSSVDDEGCRNAAFDPTLDLNLAMPGESSSTYRGYTNTTTDRNRLMFNNGAVSNQFTINKAGVLAVCYCSQRAFDGSCSMVTDTLADGTQIMYEQWVLASRLTVRGPTLGQHWTYSAHVTFRLEYTGFGLSSDDVIRIIPADGDCQDNNQDGGGGPNAAYTDTYIKLGCPHPCSEVGETSDVMNGNIEVKVLADDAYECDVKNSECRDNDIKGIRVIDENTTEIEFEAPHLMQDGDLLSLGDNVICSETSTPLTCSDERLAVLKGVFEFTDSAINYQYAPDSYMAGHIVTTTDEPKKLLIPVGWPDPKPQFVVDYVNNKRGRWTRHNKAITKEEIMGKRERLNMKVCWAYLGTPDRNSKPSMRPKHVAELGTLSLMEPNPMANTLISLTSLVKRQQTPWAPFVISFTTASAATGQRYGQVQGATRLRIFFVRTLALYATFHDGANMENNPGEDERVEARQYICGKIFRELWSSDDDLGFPMPTGCYYTRYGYTQEINIMFDRKNGLRQGKEYQLVMTGVAMDEAQSNGEYVHILAMDDVDENPYTAIERGIARLAHQPMDPAYGGEGVSWYRPDGVKAIGGADANLMELYPGANLQLQLKGNPAGGGIKAGSVIRIFLQPLTMWDVETRCTATCIPHDEVTAPCGAIQDCIGDSIVTNSNKNYLRVVMPSTMAMMTQEATGSGHIMHTLVISNLKLPQRGFFATRMGFELRKADDTKPDFIYSTGDFFYKKPENGTTVAKLINYYGDGDFRPFRGDTRNVLYATIILAATLFSNVQTGDAQMHIVLPAGYACVRTQDIDGMSPWRAEGDLGVFGDQIPQGIGSPDEGSGTRGWSTDGNRCIFSLRQNAVVYAGTSLTIRITVDNPEEAMQRTDDENRWQVQLMSKGFHQYSVAFPPVFFATQNDDRYCNNKAVLGAITDARIVPSNFAVSMGEVLSMTWLRIFFKAEQSTGVSSKVIIEMPENYTVPFNCEARSLPPHYYVTHPRMLQPPTRRLPGVLSCRFNDVPFRHVRVDLTGSVLGGEYYAFEVEATNPDFFVPETRETWKVLTRSGPDFGVDGTRNSTIRLPMIDTAVPELMDNHTAFGLYQYPLNTPEITNVRVHISNMMPYSLTGQRAQVNMTIRTPANVATTLRVVAPSGFLWDFAVNEFLYQTIDMPFDGPFAATAPLPGGAPSVVDANLLMWTGVNAYQSSRQYSFSAWIQVPDRSPTSSPNEFLVEMGHTSEDLNSRFAAQTVPVGPVRAIASAKVDYVNNVESKDNDISFQFETVTHIPYTGGINITGPPGFRLDENCVPMPAPAERGAPYEVSAETGRTLALPEDVTCMAPPAANLTGDPTVIGIVAGPGGIPPGRYRFQLHVVNPNRIVANPETGLPPCGFELCWTFTSKESYANPASADLDAAGAASGFPTNRKIVEALIPELTDMQRSLTGRDDRPNQLNPILFAIKLNNAQLDPQDLLIRAPPGSVFREDCLQDVETRGLMVFGSGQPLPQDYTAWPTGVEVTSCRGEGPNARLRVDPGATQGLQPEVRYPFRVSLLHNPSVRPEPNAWTISYGDESSDPFPGFDLWTLTRTSVHTVSIGSSTAVTGMQTFENPVTMTFMPYNTVRGAGMEIRVTAPENFQIAHDDLACSVMVQPITADASGFQGVGNSTPPNPNYLGPPSLIWGEALIDCTVDSATQRTLRARLLSSTGDKELTAGRDYQITIFVRNPIFPVGEGPLNFWTLETYNSPEDSGALPLFRDMATIPGYAVVDQVRTWFLRNGMTSGIPIYEGMKEVPGLYFEMKFPTKLEIGDVVEITTPSGFEFAMDASAGAAASNCRGFRWEPQADAALYLPNSPPHCNATRLTFTVAERRFLPEMRDLKFRLDTANPAATPHVMLNHWQCTHFNGATGTIMSTRAYLGWQIVPQLYNVRIMLVGPRRAASSDAAQIAISFMPVSDADVLELEAALPQGFDFTGCATTSNGHEIINTEVERVRVRASMFADVQVDIVITNLKLGQTGGPTLFNLVTKLSNDEQMDESLGFTGGFRLPGRLTVEEPRLTSMYAVDPVANPVTSLWNVRMAEPATAEFPFRLTMQARRGDMLRLRAPPYVLHPQRFRLIKLPSGDTVSTEFASAASGELVAIIRQVLFVTNQYEVRVEVETPNRVSMEDMWSLEVLDGIGGSLPVNTNDGITEGFRLVEQLELELRVSRSPPLAEVSAEVVVDPKTTTPKELFIVAPPGFNFTADCLVRGGDNNEIESCEQAPDIAGHAAAKLVASGVGLQQRTQYVMIKITTPASTPGDREWFVDGRDASGVQLGWGSDPVGVEVRQMVGAGVIYPGIPHISGQMAFRFVTNEKIDPNGIIRVGYPRSIVVNCDGAFLATVALQGRVTCSNFPQLGYFELELARPLPPGQQAFAVTSTCPDAVDESNTFYIVVRNPLGQVVDAAMDVPGYQIIHGIKVSAMELIWSTAAPGAASTVSMGFELLEPLPDQDPPVISELVVTIPRDFEQNVRRVSHIETLADPMPFREDTSWLYVGDPRQIVILLDEARTAVLPVGRYRFSFPLTLPARMPKYNVYTLTLCGPRIEGGSNSTCSGQDDPRALVTFPMTGFEMGDSHPSALQFMATAGCRRLASAGLLPALLAAALVLLRASTSPALGPAR